MQKKNNRTLPILTQPAFWAKNKGDTFGVSVIKSVIIFFLISIFIQELRRLVTGRCHRNVPMFFKGDTALCSPIPVFILKTTFFKVLMSAMSAFKCHNPVFRLKTRILKISRINANKGLMNGANLRRAHFILRYFFMGPPWGSWCLAVGDGAQRVIFWREKACPHKAKFTV